MTLYDVFIDTNEGLIGLKGNTTNYDNAMCAHTRLPFNFCQVTFNYNAFGSKDFQVKMIGSAFIVIEKTFIKYTCA